MHNRINNSRIGTRDKQGTVRESIILCCALFFLFNFLSSYFSENDCNASNLRLQAVAADSLTLTEMFHQKAVLEKIPAALTPFFFKKIPINYCDKELLMSVSGIGPVLADSILKTRKQVGFFQNRHDLLQVSGIGKSRMNRFATSFSFASK